MQRTFEGDKDSTRKGWTTLANVFSLLMLNTPVGALQRFTLCTRVASLVEVPSNGRATSRIVARVAVRCHRNVSSHELLYVAMWEVCARVPKVAISGLDGEPIEQEAQQLIEPRSRRHRRDPCNEHLSLLEGRIGTGCDAEGRPLPEEQVSATWGNLAGRPVLLPAAGVRKSLVALGLAVPVGRAAIRATSTAKAESDALRALMAWLEQNGPEGAIKPTLKAGLASELTGRGWDRVWASAAAKYPEIKNPGRPKNPAP